MVGVVPGSADDRDDRNSQPDDDGRTMLAEILDVAADFLNEPVVL